MSAARPVGLDRGRGRAEAREQDRQRSTAGGLSHRLPLSTGRHWQRLARESDMSPAGILELVRAVISRVSAQLQPVLDRHLSSEITAQPILNQISQGIRDRGT